jgi:acyl carrier protein
MSDLTLSPIILITLIIGVVAGAVAYFWPRKPLRNRFRTEAEAWAAKRFPPGFCAVAAGVATILRHDLGTGFEEMERNTELDALGIDEEDSAQFIQAAKATFGIEISSAEWSGFKTIDDVVVAIYAKRLKP